MLATLFNYPSDPETFNEFAFANADSHVRIAAAIREQMGVIITVPILDPIPRTDRGTWLQRHQQIHNEQNLTLGIGGSDLTQLNFDDENQIFSWTQLHAEEHRQAENQLGIG